jgi:hypothetical protein
MTDDSNAVDAFINAIVEGLTNSESFKNWLKKEFSDSNFSQEDFVHTCEFSDELENHRYTLDAIVQEELSALMPDHVREGIEEFFRENKFALEAQ